jgi:hypothetical protein
MRSIPFPYGELTTMDHSQGGLRPEVRHGPYGAFGVMFPDTVDKGP